MANCERKTIRAPLEELGIKYSSLGDALDTLQHLVGKYGRDADIDTFTYPYSDDECLYVYGMRLETDEEMHRRVCQEVEWEKRREEQDAKEYERLKQKFEPK